MGHGERKGMARMRWVEPSVAFGQDEAEALDRDGSYVYDAFLTPAGLARAREGVDGLVSRLASGLSALDIINAHQRPGGEWLWELATSPPVLDMVERMIGPDILLWSSACTVSISFLRRAPPQPRSCWQLGGPGLGRPTD